MFHPPFAVVASRVDQQMGRRVKAKVTTTTTTITAAMLAVVESLSSDR